MDNQDLLVLAKYVGKKESLDTKDTYSIKVKLNNGKFESGRRICGLHSTFKSSGYQ